MLFGMFFGAGNLIFPVHMGQEAGSSVWMANLGFMLTGIGLPFLGIIAIGISRSQGLFDLSSRVNKPYAHFITILLYLTIGPMFALPRTAAVSYEIGLSGYVSEQYQTLALAVFTALFFIIVLWFALKPGKIVVSIGKFLNPLFLIFLGILMVTTLISPMGHVDTATVQQSYQAAPLFKGVLEGYNTMDALASLAFGIIVIHALNDMGLRNPTDIAMGTVKAGIVVLLLMAIIYSLLSYVGATSVAQFPVSANGGIALAQISDFYFGSMGHIILGITVTLACLKTAIGLVTACSTTFSELYPNTLHYCLFAIIITVVSFLIANVGLTAIISLAIPILMLLYPLAVSLIVLAYISYIFGYNRIVYQWTTLFTLVAAIGDMLSAMPEPIASSSAVVGIVSFYAQTLPFFSLGMGWVVPAIIGLIVGCIIAVFRRNKGVA